jgi:phytoene dehydrogenase-like protein
VRRAVVIGSGPNGLAAAITMARAGWKVTVHEAADTVGGGVRSEELTLPGFVHDVCSAIHPLGERSPCFRDLDLDVEWIHPHAPAAHPLDDGTVVLLERGVDETADRLGADAEAYRKLLGPVVGHWGAVEPIVVGPHPPSPGTVLETATALGPAEAARTLRTALSSARAVAEDTFDTPPARAMFAGHAAHSMLPMETKPSAGFALFLIALAHVYGWALPRGGSQRLADALAARLRELGGEIRTGSRVDELPSADVVLADVVPRELLRIAGHRLPRGYAHALARYRRGPGVFKLDWALDGPIPWAAPDCARAATVHLGGTLDEIAASERDPARGRAPVRPFVLLVQPTLFDDSRAPAGKHTAWAYCHVPNGSTEDMTERIESQVERFAPGFRNLILARHALGPADFERRNANIVGGDINGGLMNLRQLVFRPVRKAVPYRTPLKGLYLCSSSTPPGGGVHGMCGYSAALVALRDS